MKRKLPALLCALALILSLAGCVISTPDTVGTIGDMEITSGLYLLAQYTAYQSAANLASSDQDAANVKSFLKVRTLTSFLEVNLNSFLTYSSRFILTNSNTIKIRKPTKVFETFS